MISAFPPWARVSAAKGKAVHTGTHKCTHIHTHLGWGHCLFWDRKGLLCPSTIQRGDSAARKSPKGTERLGAGLESEAVLD